MADIEGVQKAINTLVEKHGMTEEDATKAAETLWSACSTEPFPSWYERVEKITLYDMLVKAVSMLFDEDVCIVDIKKGVGATDEGWDYIMNEF